MRRVPAMRLSQWMAGWREVKVDEDDSADGTRRAPPRHFYLFKMGARDLLRLSGIQRRTAESRSIGELEKGIQRKHDQRRSADIAEYVRFGFPYADFRSQDRRRPDSDEARMPGWLPTAIVVNVFDINIPDERKGMRVAAEDHVLIEDGSEGTAMLSLPEEFDDATWAPSSLPPIEVIDGQHRLLAFEDSTLPDKFDLPVVAFHGLDLTWQAYLFYTINIRPVRINTSLAFDLYPLLRTERWLEISQGPLVYRETRAQELVQALYSHSSSPWWHWINMLGERGLRMVRQAAWIRSLLATYVKSPSRRRDSIGGLFGSRTTTSSRLINWDGAQQAAFLMYLGNTLHERIRDLSPSWAEHVREFEADWDSDDTGTDPAFYGRYSLLNTDQGIRGILSVSNDLCFLNLDELHLWEWTPLTFGAAYDEDVVTAAYDSLEMQEPVTGFVEELMTVLASFDWRTSSTPGLSDEQRTIKLAFRGSSGYREMRRRLLIHIEDSDSWIREWASEVIDIVGLPRGDA